MRLFIAIQFDPAVRGLLEQYQQKLKAHGVTGNYTVKENLHLTLAFIGEYPDADPVLDAMEGVPFQPFSIKMEGIGTFRDLLWAGLENNNALAAYVRRLRRALAENGIPYDRKKFSPHITLIRKMRFARMRQVTGDDLARMLEDLCPKECKMKVEKISLMRSDRGRHGMIYTEIGSVS